MYRIWLPVSKLTWVLASDSISWLVCHCLSPSFPCTYYIYREGQKDDTFSLECLLSKSFRPPLYVRSILIVIRRHRWPIFSVPLLSFSLYTYTCTVYVYGLGFLLLGDLPSLFIFALDSSHLISTPLVGFLTMSPVAHTHTHVYSLSVIRF